MSKTMTSDARESFLETCLNTIEDVKSQLAEAHEENSRLHRALDSRSRDGDVSTF